MILFIDGNLWSFPPQRGFLQELLQSAGYAGCRGVSGIIWDPVSILGWGGSVSTRLSGRMVNVRNFNVIHKGWASFQQLH